MMKKIVTVMSNNTLRILVSVFAIPVIIAAAYAGNIFFFLLVTLIALTAFYEFWLLVKTKGVSANLIHGLFSITLVLINSFKPFIDFLSIILFIILSGLLIELYRNKGSAILNIAVTLLGILYIGLFSSALLEIRELYPRIGDLYSRGGYVVISVFVSIWICDSTAYYIGSAFGKHKLFKRVSPKKSWEGAVSGFIFAVLTMILAKLIILDFLSWSTVITIGIITGFFGQIGDLIESLFKRDAGVKDSSGLIPGHGGIFDRFDSILYTAPIILLYLKHFGK